MKTTSLKQLPKARQQLNPGGNAAPVCRVLLSRSYCCAAWAHPRPAGNSPAQDTARVESQRRARSDGPGAGTACYSEGSQPPIRPGRAAGEAPGGLPPSRSPLSTRGSPARPRRRGGKAHPLCPRRRGRSAGVAPAARSPYPRHHRGPEPGSSSSLPSLPREPPRVGRWRLRPPPRCEGAAEREVSLPLRPRHPSAPGDAGAERPRRAPPPGGRGPGGPSHSPVTNSRRRPRAGARQGGHGRARGRGGSAGAGPFTPVGFPRAPGPLAAPPPPPGPRRRMP